MNFFPSNWFWPRRFDEFAIIKSGRCLTAERRHTPASPTLSQIPSYIFISRWFILVLGHSTLTFWFVLYNNNRVWLVNGTRGGDSSTGGRSPHSIYRYIIAARWLKPTSRVHVISTRRISMVNEQESRGSDLLFTLRLSFSPPLSKWNYGRDQSIFTPRCHSKQSRFKIQIA